MDEQTQPNEIPFNPHQQQVHAVAQMALLAAKARLADCYIALEDAQRDVKLAEAHLNDVRLGAVHAAGQAGEWAPKEDGSGLRRP